MKLARARVTALRLPLRTPLATAHGEVRAREGALLELVCDGAQGWAEALPLPGFGLESAEATHAALVGACRRLVGTAIDSPAEALTAAAAALAGAPAARAALDTAWRDLAARAAGDTLAAVLAAELGDTAQRSVATGCLLAGDSAAAIESAAREALAAGYDTLKLKLGSAAFERDLERASAARRAAPQAALRLDANAAWSEREAAHYLDALAPLDPEWLEQPVAWDDVAAMVRLRERAAFPLAADEAVRDLATAQRLLDAGAADVLILKPAAIGGPGAAAAIAAAARRAGLSVAVTSFLDGALGRAAALHLAAALPASPHAAGLATGGLLADDLAEGEVPRAGRLCIAAAPGLGVSPTAAAVARLATAASCELRA